VLAVFNAELEFSSLVDDVLLGRVALTVLEVLLLGLVVAEFGSLGRVAAGPGSKAMQVKCSVLATCDQNMFGKFGVK